ncbi:MAG TPA: D-Ala-D-Ala carboxypeptidase family metallohydrolase, partial [Sphingomonadales bacterium]|nr:D-Ala-D-Ala carboxypeptidase family metallohydrolase [Sphingomonadales bacterium]
QLAIRRGISNVPDEKKIKNLARLAKNILEPVRAHFGKPFTPSSGYRSAALNAALGGAAASQHIQGEAVDFEIPGIANREVAEWIRGHLEFDQLILEFHDSADPASGWVHVSLKAKANRGQCLTINRHGRFAGLLSGARKRLKRFPVAGIP